MATKGKGAKTKGWLQNVKTKSKLSFQYNPETLTYGRSATYSEIVSPGMSYPITAYSHGNAREFPSELFLYDKPYSGLIDKTVVSFLDACLPPEDNTSGFTSPPQVLFCYGTFIKKCVLLSYECSVTESDSKGNPVVATISLSFRQVE